MSALELNLRRQMDVVVPGIVVAVSGGRDYSDARHVDAVLGTIHRLWDIRLLIEGECPVRRGGLDELARLWAKRNEVNCLCIPPKAAKFGWPAAGPLRNSEIGSWMPHAWILFPGGAGTFNAGEIAHKRGIRCIEV